MRAHPVVDSRWRTYSIELDVPANAAHVHVGAAVTGDASACFDAFELETLPPPSQ